MVDTMLDEGRGISPDRPMPALLQDDCPFGTRRVTLAEADEVMHAHLRCSSPGTGYR